MSTALAAGLAPGYGIAIPVGAVAVYLVAPTARWGWRVGVAAGLGVATADGAYAFVAVLGGAAVARVVQPVQAPLRWVSGIVLLALSVRIAAAGLRAWRGGPESALEPPRTARTPATAYGRLLGITLINPTTIVYFVALVVGMHDVAGFRPGQRLVFGLGATVASASWQLGLAAGGAVVGQAVTSRRGQLATALTSSAMILLFTLRLFVIA